MSGIKHKLKKAVGGFAEAKVDDRKFQSLRERYLVHKTTLARVQKTISSVEASLGVLDEVSWDVPRELYDAMVMTTLEELKEARFHQAKELLSRLFQHRQREHKKRLEAAVKTPLIQVENDILTVDRLLEQRKNVKAEYEYYLGKFRKLEKDRDEILKNGRVASHGFTEKLERNNQKMTKFKVDFEETTKFVTQRLESLFAQWEITLEPLVHTVIDIQQKFFGECLARYAKLTTVFDAIGHPKVDTGEKPPPPPIKVGENEAKILVAASSRRQLSNSENRGNSRSTSPKRKSFNVKPPAKRGTPLRRSFKPKTNKVGKIVALRRAKQRTAKPSPATAHASSQNNQKPRRRSSLPIEARDRGITHDRTETWNRKSQPRRSAHVTTNRSKYRPMHAVFTSPGNDSPPPLPDTDSTTESPQELKSGIIAGRPPSNQLGFRYKPHPPRSKPRLKPRPPTYPASESKASGQDPARRALLESVKYIGSEATRELHASPPPPTTGISTRAALLYKVKGNQKGKLKHIRPPPPKFTGISARTAVLCSVGSRESKETPPVPPPKRNGPVPPPPMRLSPARARNVQNRNDGKGSQDSSPRHRRLNPFLSSDESFKEFDQRPLSHSNPPPPPPFKKQGSATALISKFNARGAGGGQQGRPKPPPYQLDRKPKPRNPPYRVNAKAPGPPNPPPHRYNAKTPDPPQNQAPAPPPYKRQSTGGDPVPPPPPR
mmetsp:Transcript_34575/g.83637  ORF Transcript_34575/g.83637 Transcript_34575/m.83637 type:complete len:718 (-) Transcript_34575:179-2332(-)